MTATTTLACDSVTGSLGGNPAVGTRVIRCGRLIHVAGGTTQSALRIARTLGWRVTLTTAICPDCRLPEDT